MFVCLDLSLSPSLFMNLSISEYNSFVGTMGSFPYMRRKVGSLLFFFPEKFGYIINRLITFFDPSQGDKFQSFSALDAIKLGGLTGQGMGEGILKDSVPEAHTDYVIAVISEEYGSLATIIILIIFLYISFRIIKNCFNQDNQFLKISLSGLATLMIFQTFIFNMN